MDSQIENITLSLSDLQLTNFYTIKIKKIIKIQSWFRGCLFRLKRLPLIMYKIQKYIKTLIYKCSSQNSDGRDNSKIDEKQLIPLLNAKYGDRIKNAKDRFWYDILAYDNICGWIPINLKTSNLNTSDNTGNLSICVYSYTDELLDLHRETNYDNGKMSIILFTKLKEKKYNKFSKKDYYFIVLNKSNPNDVIINSVKGLSILTPNLNNLPFQIRWDKNREFNYKNINKKIKLFIECCQKPKPNWSEIFMKYL